MNMCIVEDPIVFYFLTGLLDSTAAGRRGDAPP